MAQQQIPIGLHSEANVGKPMEDKLYGMVEKELDKLAKKHDDIISASVNISEPGHGEGEANLYEVNVTLDVRPANIAAVKKNRDLEAAMRDALDAVSRQVRDKRDRLRDY